MNTAEQQQQDDCTIHVYAETDGGECPGCGRSAQLVCDGCGRVTCVDCHLEASS